MNDLLKQYLEPDDDGRAFTDAVLLRAAGALHRRHTAHETAAALPWTALEAWARPWIIAAIVGLALVLALPGLQSGQTAAAATPTLTADLVGASTGTAYVLAETLGN
ncbi:MAG: hypothetical protein ABR998_00360 [Gemmatimonadales bacterium]|jgi:hypothetical protein